MNSLKNRIILAFALVYLIWGSTYLAIRFTVETLPPFFFAGLRFFIAGVILYLFARFRLKEPAPQKAHWRTAAIVGAFLLLGGNGFVVKAEQTIPSGLAALLVATVPLWMVLLQWLWMKDKKPSNLILGGIAIGLLGVWCLVTHDFLHFDSENIDLRGLLFLLAAPLSWSIGSVYSRKAPQAESPFLGTGMQMIVGGIFLMIVGAGLGELGLIRASDMSLKSILSFFYLIGFGSLIGYTAYIWLLKNVGIVKTSTYAFVNPVVAVFLGWAFAGEALNAQTFVGALLIIAAVCMITLQRKPQS